MRTTKLQSNVRLMASGGTKDRSIYLVEEAPGHHLAVYNAIEYNLPTPWLYYLIVHNKIETKLRMFGHNSPAKDRAVMQAVYCSPKKIRKDEDGLDWLPVGASAPHQICDFGQVVSPKASRLQVVHAAVSNFWSSNAYGYLHNPNKLLNALAPSTITSTNRYRSTINAYKDWEKLTVEQVLAAPYENIITMGNLIENVTKNSVKEVTKLNARY